MHSSDPGGPAEELTARTFVPPSSDRVASQQTDTAAIVSRAAIRVGGRDYPVPLSATTSYVGFAPSIVGHDLNSSAAIAKYQID